MGKVVNKQQLSEIFGVSEETLTNWQKVGMPYRRAEKRGQSNEYDTAETIAWRIGHLLPKEVSNSSLEQEEKRLTALRADKMEMEVGTIRSQLLPAAEVQLAWDSQVIRCRSKLLAIPSRAASMCANRPSREVNTVLTDLLHEALNELSIVDDDEPEHPADAAPSVQTPTPAAKNAPKRVGGRKKEVKPRGQRRARKLED